MRSDSSLGFGRLLSGARSATNGDSVGAPLCAFAARGNKIFTMSHPTANVPLAQAIAYLNGFPITVSMTRNGVLYATIYDYIFRNDRNQAMENINFWTFVASCKTRKLNKSTSSTCRPSAENEGSFKILFINNNCNCFSIR